jgi:hypothetical protein
MSEPDGKTESGDKKDNLIKLIIRDPSGEMIYVNASRSTLFRNIFRAYGHRLEVAPEQFQFFLDGQRISDEVTPSDIRYGEGDEIEAVKKHWAGGGKEADLCRRLASDQ